MSIAALLVSRVHAMLFLELRDLRSLDRDTSASLLLLCSGFSRVVGQWEVRTCHQIMLLWVLLLMMLRML